MTIVCGIDLSVNATQALETAALIAHRSGEALKLVHVIDELGAEVTLGGEHDSIYDPLRRQLNELASAVSARRMVDLECIVVPGVASQKLIEVSLAVGAKLIIVANSSHAKNGSWLSASVAERVAQSAPIPVLVVRENDSMESWVQALIPLKVLVGVDLNYESKLALHWALGLRKIAPCEIHVIHIVYPAEEKYRLGIVDKLPAVGLLPEMEQRLTEELRTWAGGFIQDESLKFSLLPGIGRTDSHLIASAQNLGIDLIVVGAHSQSKLGRLWRGSVSQNVLHDAPCNVACISRATEAFADTPLQRFDSLLVPTDFSDIANSAITVGYGMVTSGGTVHMLHISNPHSTNTQEQIVKKMRELIPREAEARGIRTEIQIMTSSVKGEVISMIADRLRVDAVCMGTHARKGVSKMIMGSEAQDVLSHSKRPVIMVPPDYSLS